MTNNKKACFTVDLSCYKQHIFKISLEIFVAKTNQKLSMPVWTPGSYMLREFSQHIVDIKAYDENQEIFIKKLDKNTFICANNSSYLKLEYQVYAFDSSIRAAFIDNFQAFFNGTSLFLRPHDDIEYFYNLNILPPEEQIFANWQVATALKATQIDDQGFGLYEASNYDILVDNPVQISPMKRLGFKVFDVPHEIVLVSDVRKFNEDRLKKDLQKLCESHIKIFGEKPAFEHYLFIARFEEGGFGGLEHMNSSMLLASPYSLPVCDDAEPDNNYRSFLSLCSHEYFHSYNVKRLKPVELCPYNYEKESYTSLLWFFEGFTAYYDDLILVKSGLINYEAYLGILSKNISQLLKTPGRKIQSLADSSFDAWIKFYRPHENTQNTNISYYLKGSLLALFIDLSIRKSNNNQVSLDNIMKQCFLSYSGDKGISEKDIFNILENQGLIDTAYIKNNFIYGTKELVLDEILSDFGVESIFCIDEDNGNLGCNKRKIDFGFKIKFEQQKALVQFVQINSSAMHSGLSPYDEIIAINSIRIDEKNINDIISSINAKEKVEIIYARKKQILYTNIYPELKNKDSCKLQLKKDIKEHEKNAFNKWLNL